VVESDICCGLEDDILTVIAVSPAVDDTAWGEQFPSVTVNASEALGLGGDGACPAVIRGHTILRTVGDIRANFRKQISYFMMLLAIANL